MCSGFVWLRYGPMVALLKKVIVNAECLTLLPSVFKQRGGVGFHN